MIKLRSDAIDVAGVTPRQVVEPADVAELGVALADASKARLATVIRGGGTKLEWGRTPPAVDLVVSTARLNEGIDHRHGDLTVTAAAGVPLAELNRRLAHHGQWLPIESAFEAATVGGIVATNDAGPLRHRYGTPRDLLIGITLVLADGRQVKAGGHVVKNVAGYDLGKLVSGSFGSLAAIADATFKLLPVPRASATVHADYTEPGAMARAAAAVVASQVEPAAVDVQVPAPAAPYRLLVRCASSPAATEAQIAAVRALMRAETSVVTGDAETAVWQEHIRAPWTGKGMVIRMSWLPARLDQVLALLDELRQASGAGLELRARAGVGAGLVRVEADPAVLADVVARLRAVPEVVAHVVLLRADPAVRERVDVWGPPLPAASVLRALKQSLDPMGILNAGRGPV